MKHVISALIVLLTACTRLCAEVDLGNPVGKTPYDGVFASMRQVYAGLDNGERSIGDVRDALRTAHRFRYYFDWSDPYRPQLPAITELKQQGDCKAKSLWLAEKMNTSRARYVVGKASLNSKMAHCWLLWPYGGRWLLLDPVNSAEPIDAEAVAGKKLFPKFSYVGSHSWRHPTYHEYFP